MDVISVAGQVVVEGAVWFCTELRILYNYTI